MANEDLRRVKTYVGASGKLLRFQMRDPDTGAVVDISSGYSNATISARFSGESTYKIQAEALTIEVGTQGWVSFYPSPGGIDTEGDLRAQIRIINPVGIDFTDKFIIEVDNPYHYTA